MEMSSSRGPFNRSVRELNNKNNLASLRLRKELAGFDREKKFLMEHIEKNRVDTYSFLKQLQFCGTNLVPAYKELLEGIVTRPSMTRRRARKARTAPSSGSSTDDQNEAGQKGDQKQPFVPKFTKAQMKLLQARTNTVSNQDRAEMFMKRLRQKQCEKNDEEAEDNLEPELAMSRKLSRLTSVATVDQDLQDRWAKPRQSGFHSVGRLGSIASRHRPSDVFDGTLPALSQAVPELVSVKCKDIRISVTSPQDDCFGRPVRNRPLDNRVREFYDKLDILKKKQEERMADLPIWEKRRRWVMLTKGIGAALAESDSESDDDMDIYGIY